MFTPARPPVKVHLPSALHIVFEDLESALLLGFDVCAHNNLAANTEPKHIARTEM